jgi:predicted DNA-binding transcriptional regulator YafY
MATANELNHTYLKRLLDIMLDLSGNHGYTVKQLQEKHDLTQRSVYRYFITFKECGFIIEKKSNRHRISKQSPYIKDFLDLVYFSAEEQQILGKAILSIHEGTLVRDNLLRKLHALYENKVLPSPFFNKQISNNLSLLFEAIRHKRQALLRSYRSANSQIIRDRMVEPFKLSPFYNSVWCFEPESGQNKLFIVKRIGTIELFDKTWQNEDKHQDGLTDIFRISGPEKIAIELEISLRAYNLLLEEYPLSEPYLSKLTDQRYLFNGWVCGFEGVSRFIMGLAGEVKILKPIELKHFLIQRMKMAKF